MKSPIPLPFLHRGEEVPPSRMTLPAARGFLLSSILSAVTAPITYFVIRAAV